MTPGRSASELLALWSRTVEEVERGYPLTYDDYLNDLDVRHALSAHAPTAELTALDARFVIATYPAGECVWGPDNAEAEGWDRELHWYYWRLPRHPGPTFEADASG